MEKAEKVEKVEAMRVATSKIRNSTLTENSQGRAGAWQIQRALTAYEKGTMRHCSNKTKAMQWLMTS